ncbi:hypothetical protein M8J77_011020 [Diaphorina citri]|nr:hypothetical protein M8J77_011020 [Diaphorina citri]
MILARIWNGMNSEYLSDLTNLSGAVVNAVDSGSGDAIDTKPEEKGHDKKKSGIPKRNLFVSDKVRPGGSPPHELALTRQMRYSPRKMVNHLQAFIILSFALFSTTRATG